MRFHPAGKTIIRNTIILVIVLNVLGWLSVMQQAFSILLPVISLFVLIAVLQFFRYPSRIARTSEKQILAPADGTVCLIEESEEQDYLKKRCLKVSIFMSPLNVHINWVPIAGEITFLKHKTGKFYAAFKDKSAEENERFCTVIRIPDGREIMANQVAGAMARRILNFLHEGQQVKINTEMGFIRFGSRVDLYLPTDTDLSVKLGDKVSGNKSIIGELS